MILLILKNRISDVLGKAIFEIPFLKILEILKIVKSKILRKILRFKRKARGFCRFY